MSRLINFDTFYNDVEKVMKQKYGEGSNIYFSVSIEKVRNGVTKFRIYESNTSWTAEHVAPEDVIAELRIKLELDSKRNIEVEIAVNEQEESNQPASA